MLKSFRGGAQSTVNETASGKADMKPDPALIEVNYKSPIDFSGTGIGSMLTQFSTPLCPLDYYWNPKAWSIRG